MPIDAETLAALPGLLEDAHEGPWTAELDDDTMRFRVHSSDALICCVGNVGMTLPEEEAAARLLALAPDLAREVLALRERLALADKLAEVVGTFNETVGTDPVAVDYARDDMDAALAATLSARRPAGEEGA